MAQLIKVFAAKINKLNSTPGTNPYGRRKEQASAKMTGTCDIFTCSWNSPFLSSAWFGGSVKDVSIDPGPCFWRVQFWPCSKIIIFCFILFVSSLKVWCKVTALFFQILITNFLKVKKNIVGSICKHLKKFRAAIVTWAMISGGSTQQSNEKPQMTIYRELLWKFRAFKIIVLLITYKTYRAGCKKKNALTTL